jgi:hypothetical protein
MEHLKTAGDTLSLIAVLGTLAKLLPALAALASLIWYGIRIYEYFKGKRGELKE